jgi:fused signal recognition particle receptor
MDWNALQQSIWELAGRLGLVPALEALEAWAQANPAHVSHIAFAVPIVLGVLLVAVFRWRRRARAVPADATAAKAEEPPAAIEAPLEEPETPEELPAGAPAPEVSTTPLDLPVPEAVPEPEPPPEPRPEPEPEPQPEPPPRRVPLRERLARTSDALVGRLGSLLGGRSVDADVLDELEALLFTADLGVATAEDLLARVKREASGADGAEVRRVLRDAIAEKLQKVEPSADPLGTEGSPHVILVLGVNGAGKTTTIGKLAARYGAAGHRVVLGAADTFRAAAREQLQTWAERAGCELVSGPDGGDPAAVAFDTVKQAAAQGCDVAIIDTAGRLQNKVGLMEELSKIARVIGRDVAGAPHETLLVLDANTGQSAISQAREFTAAAPVTGLVLTKLDGTAKGGVIVGLADEFGIPVKFVGVGEGVEDLRDFEAEGFVAALFGDDAEAG